jgi:hypothetical protein
MKPYTLMLFSVKNLLELHGRLQELFDENSVKAICFADVK